jgi:hypothetical protein
LFKIDVSFKLLILHIILNMDHVGIFILFYFFKRIVPNTSHKSVISSHQQLKLKMREKKGQSSLVMINDVCFKFFSTNIIVNGGQ